MEPAGLILAAAVDKVTITKPICPIYQNVAAAAVTDLDAIRDNLIAAGIEVRDTADGAEWVVAEWALVEWAVSGLLPTGLLPS